MFNDHLTQTNQESKEVLEGREKYKIGLDRWVELMRHPYWELNVEFIKQKIVALERELVKTSDKTNLDGAMQSMAVMRSIKEMKSLLSHYEIVVKEKMHYDVESANSKTVNADSVDKNKEK